MSEEFKRKDLLFSLCGLNCSLCPMFIGKRCGGCIEGSMCYMICDIAPCSMEHGNIEYCFECVEYPCDKYDGIDKHDSLMTHKNQLKDMEKARKMGIKNYRKEQKEKVEILDKMLREYNHEQNEVFLCTSVNLLELEDLKKVMELCDKNSVNMDLKEKYETLKKELDNCAKIRGIKLELRR